jgi:hypothetical protein
MESIPALNVDRRVDALDPATIPELRIGHQKRPGGRPIFQRTLPKPEDETLRIIHRARTNQETGPAAPGGLAVAGPKVVDHLGPGRRHPLRAGN